jgi:hypothetical protein
MPERTHATATPRPAVSIGARRSYPLPGGRHRPDRNRWPRGRPRAQRSEREGVNAARFLQRFKGVCGRDWIRKLTALPAHAGEPPKMRASVRPARDQTRSRRRRPQAAAAPSGSIGAVYLPRAASAPARSKYKEHGRASRKCQSAHTPQPPLGQRFRSARAKATPYLAAGTVRIETAGRGVALARVRMRRKMLNAAPLAARSCRRSPEATRQLLAPPPAGPDDPDLDDQASVPIVAPPSAESSGQLPRDKDRDRRPKLFPENRERAHVRMPPLARPDRAADRARYPAAEGASAGRPQRTSTTPPIVRSPRRRPKDSAGTIAKG